MDAEKYLNKKYLVPAAIILFLILLFVFITAKNLRRDGSADREYTGLNDSLKQQAIEDIEDLVNTDYGKYYDDLKNYGEWIKINPKDYIKNRNKQNKSTADRISEYLLKAAGVDNAYAYDDFYFNAFFVWQPSPGFAVGMAAGEPQPAVFTPYTYGRWVYTDYGWYFRAPTYEAEIVHHYGRWVFVPAAGWVWIPGSRWAPAWVHWEYDDDYIAWSPLVPNIYYASNYIYVPPVYTPVNFIATERRYFVYPDLYKHVYCGPRENIVIKEKLKIRDDKYFYDYSVRNGGPRMKDFDRNYARWDMKPKDVDFMNRGHDERASFRDNTALGRKFSEGQNFRTDKSGMKENPVKGLKRDKNNRSGKDFSGKEKFRGGNKNEKQNRNVNGKNVTERRKERTKDYNSGRNFENGKGRNKEYNSPGKNREFKSPGNNREFKSPGNNREFKSPGKNRSNGNEKNTGYRGGNTREQQKSDNNAGRYRSGNNGQNETKSNNQGNNNKGGRRNR